MPEAGISFGRGQIDMAMLVDYVMVGKREYDLGVVRQDRHQLIEKRRFPFVVVVQDCDEFPGDQVAEGLDMVGRDTQSLFISMIDNARIGEASSDFAIRIAAQIVGHDDFDVAVVAVYSTGNRAAQISGAVVSRD